MTGPSAVGEIPLPNSIIALAYSGLVLGKVAESGVTDKDKATLVASVALWSLRQRSNIAFSRGWSSHWIWRSQALMVSIVGGEARDPEIESRVPFRPTRYSFEQELLNVVRFIAARPRIEADVRVMVREVIEAWLGQAYENPYQELIDRVTDQGKTAGCYLQTSVQRGSALARFLLGPISVNVLIAAREPELKHAAQKLAREWHQFTSEEPDLSGALIATVADGIKRRTIPRYYGD